MRTSRYMRTSSDTCVHRAVAIAARNHQDRRMDERTQQPPRHRVVVIGSGFGGLFATKALRRAPVDVTMIARTTHHLFQPLLYQVATRILSQGEIAPPTREILRRQRNAAVLFGDVTDVAGQ